MSATNVNHSSASRELLAVKVQAEVCVCCLNLRGVEAEIRGGFCVNIFQGEINVRSAILLDEKKKPNGYRKKLNKFNNLDLLKCSCHHCDSSNVVIRI